jgi:hypothetical protein
MGVVTFAMRAAAMVVVMTIPMSLLAAMSEPPVDGLELQPIMKANKTLLRMASPEVAGLTVLYVAVYRSPSILQEQVRPQMEATSFTQM